MIAKEDCIKGAIYRIHARNIHFGVFDGDRGFIGIRRKFGTEFLDTEIHYDADPNYGTAKPVMQVGVVPEEWMIDTDNQLIFDLLKEYEARRKEFDDENGELHARLD